MLGGNTLTDSRQPYYKILMKNEEKIRQSQEPSFTKTSVLHHLKQQNKGSIALLINMNSFSVVMSVNRT